MINTGTIGMEYVCSICMESTLIEDELSDNKLCHFNGCKHSACASCLTTWYENERYDCPQCRVACNGVQTVKHSIYLLEKEYMILENEIYEMRSNISSRCKINSILRADMVRESNKIDKLIEEYGCFNSNDQSIAIQNMENIGGFHHVPHHVRALNYTPFVFCQAAHIRKTTENSICLKTSILQMNIIRDEYELDQIEKYTIKQHEIMTDIHIFLSNYSEPKLIVEDAQELNGCF